MDTDKKEKLKFSKTVLDLRENGSIILILDRVKVPRPGLMALCMKATGLRIRPTDRVVLSTLMVTSIQVPGKTIRPMVMVFTAI